MCYGTLYLFSCEDTLIEIRPRTRLVGIGAALGLAALVSVGCATRGSVRRLEGHATSLEQSLGELRRSEERLSREIARLASDVQALDAGIRDTQATARDAASQAAALRGRLDSLEAPQPGRAHSRPPTAEAGLADPATIKPGRAHSRPPTVGSGLADPATINREYAAALATFRAREHGQAVLDFLEFIARYPSHPLAAGAQYWIGEAYYAQRDYRQALVEFEKVLARPGSSASAPDSLWKIGLCHANLRAAARARETWQRLVREYPGSEAARRARARLTPRGAHVAR